MPQVTDFETGENVPCIDENTTGKFLSASKLHCL